METTTRAPRASYVRGVPSVWEWEEQKSLIYRLWITEDKKLPELQQTLYNLHGFYASHGQFMTMFKKWKYEKKISPEDAKLILAVKQKRWRKRKESLFFLHGVKIGPAKIERWIARKAFSKEEIENLEAGAETLLPAHIRVHTPEPDGSTPASAIAAPLIDRTENPHNMIHSTILQRDPARDEASTISLAPSAERSFTVTTRPPPSHPSAYPTQFSTTMPRSTAAWVAVNKHQSRYSRVKVLLLSWGDDICGRSNVEALRRIFHNFKDSFNFSIETWEIETKNSDSKLHSKIFEFASTAKTEELLVVYYSGEGRLNQDRELILTSQYRAVRKNDEPVSWSGIQDILEKVESDVLILLGCCAPVIPRSSSGHGVTELIAACGFEAKNTSISFTSGLSHALSELCSKSTTFTVNALYSRILLYQQEGWIHGGVLLPMAPVHLTLVEDQESSRKIVFCSLPKSFGSTIAIPIPLNERAMPSSEPSISRPHAAEPTMTVQPRKRTSDQISTSDRSQGSVISISDLVEPVCHDPSTSIFATKRVKQQIEDTGHYFCTYEGCKRKYPKFFDWKRHEAQHWKTERWDCLICSTEIDKGTCKKSKVPNFCRKDKLAAHIRSMHNVTDHPIDASWSRPLDDDWPRKCKFCEVEFETWNARASHIGRHFAKDAAVSAEKEKPSHEKV